MEMKRNTNINIVEKGINRIVGLRGIRRKTALSTATTNLYNYLKTLNYKEITKYETKKVFNSFFSGNVNLRTRQRLFRQIFKEFIKCGYAEAQLSKKTKYRLRSEWNKVWREKNKEKRRGQQKKYFKIPKNKIALNLRVRVNQALKLYTKAGKIRSSCEYGIDYKKIIEHLKPFPKEQSKYHIDHIKPLCSFNFINEDETQNLEEIRKAFAPKNHQWLLAKDNLSKGGKI